MAAKLLWFYGGVGLFNYLLFIVYKALCFGHFSINSVDFLGWGLLYSHMFDFVLDFFF